MKTEIKKCNSTAVLKLQRVFNQQINRFLIYIIKLLLLPVAYQRRYYGVNHLLLLPLKKNVRLHN